MIESPLENSQRVVPPIELSVVIPMFNAAETIAAQLEALLAERWSQPWEIVVADNGSSDGSHAIVTSFNERDSRVRLVDASDERGPAHARNVGVSYASGASVAFCDADDVVAPGWVAAMGDALRGAPAATGPQEQARLNPPWLQNVYGSRLADSAQSFAGVFPFGASANLGVVKKEFVRLGGFDPSIRVGEDIEFCLRLWAAGLALVFVPEAMIHYRNRPSTRALMKQAVQYGAAGPMIVRRLTVLGHSAPSRVNGARNWLWLLRNALILRSKAGRARWSVVAGRSLGRLLGSLRYRTLYL